MSARQNAVRCVTWGAAGVRHRVVSIGRLCASPRPASPVVFILLAAVLAEAGVGIEPQVFSDGFESGDADAADVQIVSPNTGTWRITVEAWHPASRARTRIERPDCVCFR